MSKYIDHIDADALAAAQAYLHYDNVRKVFQKGGLLPHTFVEDYYDQDGEGLDTVFYEDQDGEGFKDTIREWWQRGKPVAKRLGLNFLRALGSYTNDLASGQ